MLEKELERTFQRRMLDAGLLSLKFTSPGQAGVPDRIVLIPRGRVVFVELKRPGETLRPLQRHVIGMLDRIGFETWVIDSKDALSQFETYLRNMGVIL